VTKNGNHTSVHVLRDGMPYTAVQGIKPMRHKSQTRKPLQLPLDVDVRLPDNPLPSVIVQGFILTLKDAALSACSRLLLFRPSWMASSLRFSQ
jgi:hypothetical protein